MHHSFPTRRSSDREIGWILKTQLIGDFGGRNSRVCQLPLGMHELLLVHYGDGSEAQEFLAGLTEPRGIHLQNLPIIADLQIASDFPLDTAAKAHDEIERRARHFLDCIGTPEIDPPFTTPTDDSYFT